MSAASSSATVAGGPGCRNHLSPRMHGSVPTSREAEASAHRPRACVSRVQGSAPAWWPLLLALGQEPNIHYIGPVGTAAGVKLALNQLIASLTVRCAGGRGPWVMKLVCCSIVRAMRRRRVGRRERLAAPQASRLMPLSTPPPHHTGTGAWLSSRTQA